MLFGSCTKMLIEKDPKNDPESNFETMWKNVDEKYSFFVDKNINWDSIGDYYRAIIDKNTSDTTLFRYLGDMLYNLEDGHVNLYSDFDVSRNWSWYLDYEPNYYWDVVQREYLGDDYMITGGLKHTSLNDSIAYVHYGSFMSLVSKGQMAFIMERYGNYDGIILDLRNNGGGLVLNASTLTSYFIETEVVGYKEYIKGGAGHNEFYGPIEHAVEPADTNRFNKPIVLLTNRHCYSATNLFVGMMKGLPNVHIIGDFTGGGGGMPSDYEIPNGWTYRFSTTVSVTRDGYNLEFGVAPDAYVTTGLNDANQGKDAIIDAALNYLQSL